MRKNSYWLFIVAVLLILAVSACRSSPRSGSANPTSLAPVTLETALPTVTQPLPPSPSASPTQVRTPSQMPLPSPSSTPTLAPTATSSPTPAPTLTPSITPTYAILRATVLEQSNCRYGPGAAYLYKYGLWPGYNIEVIGRNDLGTWIVIEAIGGTNPCWVKASLLDIHGEVMSVAPMELPLPMSPYYGPLSGVYAERHGNDVIISWNPMELRAGDDSLQYPYLVEAWLCHNGQISFDPIGSWEPMVTVQDEPGCAEPSHARVYGVEKHGYTLWRAVPWPAP